MWPHFAVFIEMSCILRPCWLLYNSQNSTAGSHQRGNYPWTPCPQNIVFVIFGAPSFLSLASSNVVRNGCYLTCVAYFLINPQVRWYWDFCGNTPPQHFQRQNCSPRFLHSQNSCQSPETSHSQVPSHLQQNHFIFLFFFPSLSSISTLLPHPCQLNSYYRLKLRLIYWEEKRCTIAQIRSSIDAFAISFPLSASAQPAKLSQSSLWSTLAEEETANPTNTAQRDN